jgi:hypothetical protein
MRRLRQAIIRRGQKRGQSEYRRLQFHFHLFAFRIAVQSNTPRYRRLLTAGYTRCQLACVRIPRK